MLGQMRGEGEMIKKLMAGAVAAFLLVVAPQAMAQSVDLWLVVGWDSASGEVSVESDLCLSAVLELTNEQGFELRSVSPVGRQGGEEVSAFVFTRLVDPDVASLFCITDINVGKPGEPGRPGEPGKPGKPGKPG
jgi:hypothetical protein